MSPHKLRHFQLAWLKKQSIDDALIQPYSDHESRKSLEVYSKLAITDAQNEFNEAINQLNFLFNPLVAGGVINMGTPPYNGLAYVMRSASVNHYESSRC
ncbi:hypothetical protein MKY42_20660 [Paenibacillus sp. FSL W7-1088]|uniref:hypothetical protein n=1 Tax=Paenibacillus sp. FSL W7-1088 TaxID=2921695 RepID=UPI0030EB8C73